MMLVFLQYSRVLLNSAFTWNNNIFYVIWYSEIIQTVIYPTECTSGLRTKT